jgi:hypothetical protein
MPANTTAIDKPYKMVENQYDLYFIFIDVISNS